MTDDLQGWRDFEALAMREHLAALKLAHRHNRWAERTAAWLAVDLMRIRAQVAKLEAATAKPRRTRTRAA